MQHHYNFNSESKNNVKMVKPSYPQLANKLQTDSVVFEFSSVPSSWLQNSAYQNLITNISYKLYWRSQSVQIWSMSYTWSVHQ